MEQRKSLLALTDKKETQYWKQQLDIGTKMNINKVGGLPVQNFLSKTKSCLKSWFQ